MKKLEKLLKEESENLKDIIINTKQRLVDTPEGNLRVRTWKGKTEYYYKNNISKNTKESRENGRYLKKNEENMAKSIAQRDYDREVVVRAMERCISIEKILKTI